MLSVQILQTLSVEILRSAEGAGLRMTGFRRSAEIEFSSLALA